MAMKKLMITLIFLVTLSSPALAIEPMSNDELKKTTAQIASIASKVPSLYAKARTVVGLIIKGIDNNKHVDNLVTTVGPGLTAQELTTPVREVTIIVSDANNFKSAVSFGFF